MYKFVKNIKIQLIFPYRILYIAILSFYVLSISGCLFAGSFAAVQTGTVIAQEKSAGSAVDDTVITSKIKSEFAQKAFGNLFSRISVNVSESRVMLTGSVTDESYIQQAESIAWKVLGVKEVINELIVSDKALKDRAKDAWISTQIKAKFLLQKHFDSLNYVPDVNNQIVYLLGIAQNQEELDTALEIASSIKGVEKVVNHVILKSDARRVEK